MPEKRLPPWSATQERIADPVIRLMTVANVWAYRLTGGRLGGTFLRGAPICLVTTTGKRSGQPRTVALLYLPDGDDVVLVASKGGMSKSPAWYHNMMANPEVARADRRDDPADARAARVGCREGGAVAAAGGDVSRLRRLPGADDAQHPGDDPVPDDRGRRPAP